MSDADLGRVKTLVVERPPLNILDIATMERLAGRLDELAADDELQLLVVRGAGPKAFSAGVAVEDHVPGRIETVLATFHALIRKLRDLPAITVAAVHGHCLGGGMELASACDLVVATEDARFGVPEIKLGCYPPVAVALYPKLVGRHRALEIVLTGDTMSAEEAWRLGLVNRVVPTAELDAAVDRLVAAVTANSAAVARLVKRAVAAGEGVGFDAALDAAERLYLTELVETRDMHEGIAAFLEKRRPEWKHS